jgi:TusA-related sulfurtransferase
MEPGAYLRITGEDPAAGQSIRRTCSTHGFVVEDGETDDASFALSVYQTVDTASS